jgi:hypothetical protein
MKEERLSLKKSTLKVNVWRRFKLFFVFFFFCFVPFDWLLV